jgi:DNA-binding winged helix-turn-helix (wHTH) protein
MILKAAGAQGRLLYKFGPFLLDPQEYVLLHDSEQVSLTPKNFEMLLVLVQRAGRIVGKNELIQKVWPDTFITDSTLAQNIFTLRQILAGRHPGQLYIETVPRRGYRFAAPVMTLTDDADSAPAGIFAKPDGPVQGDNARPAEPKVDSLAVLPLMNVSADPDVEPVADGLTDSLIHLLSELPTLRIISRSTAFRYKGVEVDPRHSGRDLGIKAVLVGRVQRRADRLSIGLELVDVAHGWRLWGGQYEGDLSELSTTQEELAERIAANLRMKLTGEGGNVYERAAGSA